MRRFLLAILSALVLTLAAPLTASASSGSATIYVVHGIPGADLGLDPALPVDISVSGGCAITDFTFGTITDGVALPAGAYDLAIYLAQPGAGNECSGAPVISAAGVMFDAGKSYAVVAHLTETGGITAGVFGLDTSRVRAGTARVIVHHTAAAPAVDICIVRGNGSKLTLAGVSNGDQGTVSVRPGRYYIDLAPAGSDTVVFGPVNVKLENRKTYLVFAVGSLDNGTFTLLTKVI